MNIIRRPIPESLSLVVFLAAACATTPTAKPHEAKFSYLMPQQAAKIDVNVGLLAPQFAGEGVSYEKENTKDVVVRGMLRGIRTSFNELLVAKGFNTSGPFESLDAMTFPEKKGADFVLYPEFDLESGFSISNPRQDVNLLGTPVLKCQVSIQPRGIISIVVREPLSKEKMWTKRIELALAATNFEAEDRVCAKQGVTQEIANSWAEQHEQIYGAVMSALDKYVSADEFRSLKAQAAELRAKKTY